MNEDETFNKLRRIPFEQLSIIKRLESFFMPSNMPKSQKHAQTMGLAMTLWKDEGGWDFPAFKEEYNKRFGEQ